MNNTKILIVEDNPIIAMDIESAVKKLDYIVTDKVSREKDVFQSIDSNEPNLILMDINLSQGECGIEIVKKLHKSKYIPIIYLTGRNDDETINKALETCPIGYIPKPFNQISLKTTIKLALCEKRESRKKKFKYINSDYHFDMNDKILYYKGEIVKLSENETEFFYLLIKGDGELVLYKTIKSLLWDDPSVSEDALRLMVSRLRAKLKCELIKTVYGYGFKLNRNL